MVLSPVRFARYAHRAHTVQHHCCGFVFEQTGKSFAIGPSLGQESSRPWLYLTLRLLGDLQSLNRLTSFLSEFVREGALCVTHKFTHGRKFYPFLSSALLV